MSESRAVDKPVLFLLFNRPDLAELVFEEIRKAAPPRLYFSVDGPREDRAGEVELVEQCRRLKDRVDWKCEVFTNFQETNLGCGRAVSEGISWFFEREESGIILEDDCLPSPQFFRFVSDLLDRYRDDEKVMHVTGSNHQRGVKRTSADYYFSRYEHVWGWASWRRAWEKYDFGIKTWRKSRDRRWLETLFGNPEKAGRFWTYIFDQVKAGEIDTWDYQWRYTIWDTEGFSIIPEVNLISNIGFDPRATHTLDEASLDANIPHGSLTFPLHHPESQELCDEADHFHEGCYLPREHSSNPIRRVAAALRNRFHRFR